MSWFPSKIPSKAALLAVSPETYPFPLVVDHKSY